MSESWFISDLHLDPSKPHLFGLFQTFVRSVPPSLDALYILGDLFEYWIGDDVLDSPLSAYITPTVKLLSDLSSKGVPVYFIHGNRDFLMGQRFADDAGVQLLDEEHIVDLYGQRVLLMHGDQLCTDDTAYQQFRSMARSPQWQADILSLSIPDRIAKANEIREESAHSALQKTHEIMDVNTQAVLEVVAKHDVNMLIHGHTHRPAIHSLNLAGQPATRIVLGDWCQSPSVLRLGSNRLHLTDGR